MSIQSESIKELAGALAKAQSEIHGASKDGKNTHFNAKYATLASTWEACREPLTKNNLAVIQTTSMVDNELVLVTTLVHSSGEWVKGVMPVRSARPDMQSLGSALSYSRRYSLGSMVGVAAVDDDGEASVGRDVPVEVKKEAPKAFAAPKDVQERNAYKFNKGPWQGKTFSEIAFGEEAQQFKKYLKLMVEGEKDLSVDQKTILGYARDARIV